MLLHNPHDHDVYVKRPQFPKGLHVPAKQSIPLTVEMRLALGTGIQFFGLQVLPGSASSSSSPLEHKEIRSAATSPTHTHRVVVSSEEQLLPPMERRPSVVLEDGSTMVSGDPRLTPYETTDTLDGLLIFQSSHATEASGGSTDDAPAEPSDNDDALFFLPPPAPPEEGDPQRSTDGDDASYVRMVQELHQRDVPPTVSPTPHAEPSPPVPGRDERNHGDLETWFPDLEHTDEDPFSRDELDALKQVWDISGRLNPGPTNNDEDEDQDDADVPTRCPYTRTQLNQHVKAKLWEIASSLGLDESGSKKDLIERIIGFYEE